MRPEATVQRRGNRSAPDFSWLFASSVMYVASLTGMTREKRNHIRHHQPQKPTVRESGVAPKQIVRLVRYGVNARSLAQELDLRSSRSATASNRRTWTRGVAATAWRWRRAWGAIIPNSRGAMNALLAMVRLFCEREDSVSGATEGTAEGPPTNQTFSVPSSH